MSAPNAATLSGMNSNMLSSQNPNGANNIMNSSNNGGGNGNGNGSGNGNGNASKMMQIEQLLRRRQMQELQQLQQLKQHEEMQRLSQFQSRDAVLLMLQQQQQQQQQRALTYMGGGGASMEAQLKALQQQQQHQQQEQQQNNNKSQRSNETSVANLVNGSSNTNGGNSNSNIPNGITPPNNTLSPLQFQQMIASHQFQQQQQKQQQLQLQLQDDNRRSLQQQQQQQHQQQAEGMPPPPMVSAVSSLDSVAIMQMLLPKSQQQNQQQQSSSAGGLLGVDITAGGNGGMGNNSNLNSSLFSPMPFPPASMAALGMHGGGNSSLYGGLGGQGGLSNMMSRQNGLGSSSVGGGGGNVAIHPSAADVIYEQRRLAAAAEVSNNVRDSSIGKPPDAFVDRDPDGRARDLPTLLVVPMDHMQLSSHQTLLRYQIEVFRAGEEDTSTHTRGRNKPVQLGQIGIRCRHCKVLPVSRRKRGSVYFPRAVEGFYQAAQNMNSTHLQTGECPLMGNALRQEFANLIATRGVSTGAGRAYWAKQARKLGLRNTDTGIVFDKLEAGVVGEGNASNSNHNNNNNNSSS